MKKKTPYYRTNEVTLMAIKDSFQRGLQRFLLPAAFSVCMLSATVNTNAQVIATIAGNGIEGYSGDGNAAIAAQTEIPYGVASDNSGNVYFSDPANQVIRKVNGDGIISTVAGTGKAGYSGDGGQATNAQLNNPMGIAVDGAGNVYIADETNNVIRKIDRQGYISTVAGNGRQGYKGDGHRATRARLNQPYGVSVDATGTIYIADTWNNVIRKVDPSGVINTVAGCGTGGYGGDGDLATKAKLNLPYAVTADVYGTLFIADSWNNVIRRVNSLGMITTIGGTGKEGFTGDGGPAIAATFDVPMGINVDKVGNLYIADASNQVIRKIDKEGIVSTFAGNHELGNGHSGDGYQSVAAQLNFPTNVAIDGTGNIYIADHDNSCIRKVTPYGQGSENQVASTITTDDTHNSTCECNAKATLVSNNPVVAYNWHSTGSDKIQHIVSDKGNNQIKVNTNCTTTVSAVVAMADASSWSQSVPSSALPFDLAQTIQIKAGMSIAKN